MVTSKKDFLMPLIQSSGGIHLSAYLCDIFTPSTLKKSIKKIISDSRKLMSSGMSKKEIDVFLMPILRLSNDVDFYKKAKANFALFLTKDYFQIVNIPIGVDNVCVISSSFHVKPLLKWIQTDRDFLFLCFDETTACLYQGNLYSMNYVDSVFFPEARKTLIDKNEVGTLKSDQMKRIVSLGTVEWLEDWIEALTLCSKTKVFISGNKDHINSFLNDYQLDYPQFKILKCKWPESKMSEYFTQIRSSIIDEIRKEEEYDVAEIKMAAQLKLTSSNIFQISKCAIEGKVKKIFIADDINIFGIMNKNTGNLAIHIEQANIHDDDVLDDLAQEVMKQGGEVVLLPRKRMPDGVPALAILHSDNKIYNAFVLNSNIDQTRKKYLNLS